jgi:hypothetical protein
LWDGDIKLFKIDTDGYDFALLDAYLEELSKRSSNIYFELEVRNADDFNDWTRLLSRLFRSGYSRLIFWDDPGRFMGAFRNAEQALDLVHWQHSYHRFTDNQDIRIHNFDVLAVADNDEELADKIVATCRNSSC